MGHNPRGKPKASEASQMRAVLMILVAAAGRAYADSAPPIDMMTAISLLTLQQKQAVNGTAAECDLCVGDSNCAFPLSCIKGRCLQANSADKQMGEACCDDSQCASGKCTWGQCSCQVTDCVQDEYCGVEDAYNWAFGTADACHAKKGECGCCFDNSYCDQGLECHGGSCIVPATKNEGQECCADAQCSTGYCCGDQCLVPASVKMGDACCGDDQCMTGKCDNGMCVCNTDSHCPLTQYCDKGPLGFLAPDVPGQLTAVLDSILSILRLANDPIVDDVVELIKRIDIDTLDLASLSDIEELLERLPFEELDVGLDIINMLPLQQLDDLLGLGQNQCKDKKTTCEGCNRNGQCSSGRCRWLKCVAPVPATVEMGGACCHNEQCTTGSCGGGTCQCNTNGHCPAGQYCKKRGVGQSNTCENLNKECEKCDRDYECAGNARCHWWKCVTDNSLTNIGDTCCSDAQCSGGMTCKNSRCQCTRDNHCPNDQWCKWDLIQGNKCVPAKQDCEWCLHNGQCGNGSACRFFKCSTRNSVDMGGACCRDHQCGTGSCRNTIGEDRVCQCKLDSHCPAGHHCSKEW